MYGVSMASQPWSMDIVCEHWWDINLWLMGGLWDRNVSLLCCLSHPSALGINSFIISLSVFRDAFLVLPSIFQYPHPALLSGHKQSEPCPMTATFCVIFGHFVQRVKANTRNFIVKRGVVIVQVSDMGCCDRKGDRSRLPVAFLLHSAVLHIPDSTPHVKQEHVGERKVSQHRIQGLGKVIGVLLISACLHDCGRCKWGQSAQC